MGEQEPNNETIGRGQLFYLWHLEVERTFSGYGITLEANNRAKLVGLMMVNRPFPADQQRLHRVNETFGECRLVPMTETGEQDWLARWRSIQKALSTCDMPSMKSLAIQTSLRPFLEEPPAPKLRLSWDDNHQFWASEFDIANELPLEIRQMFEQTEYGCLTRCLHSYTRASESTFMLPHLYSVQATKSPPYQEGFLTEYHFYSTGATGFKPAISVLTGRLAASTGNLSQR